MATPITQAHPGAAAYAAALDGLELLDPVKAFFDFCRERESVRQLRESGAPAPWSQDEIFQKARFLNVFREDDRATKSLLHFLGQVDKQDDKALLQAIFFGRWCNRDSTLDMLPAGLLANEDPAALQDALKTLNSPPWCNETAYPVGPIEWEGISYERFEAATGLFGKISEFLVEAVRSADRDVHKATQAVNSKFGMNNDFPIFMAIMDIAWFRPDLIDPASLVPTGIGAVAFINRLQEHLQVQTHDEVLLRMIELQPQLWPEAKRPFQPIDIEYLCCECRKYYSYVNGTKLFEGKNVFKPGESPQL
jgi:hypothetical protein